VAPIECTNESAKDDKRAKVPLCKEDVRKAGESFGFPTWEINGQKILNQLTQINLTFLPLVRQNPI
jgi:hypothetical protein